MKNISKQYQDLLEGKMNRDNFVRNCRQQFPQFVSPVTSIDDAIKILKGKRIIAESISENIDYKDPYVKGYIDNENGSSLEDCPYDEHRAATLWKNGWMDCETEKQMDHDEDTYNRETGGYGDLYKENIDINDRILMATRARRDRESAPQYEPTLYKNADKLKALQMKKAQIMRDMEQEAEPEGGPIADQYGAELEKIDRAISALYENKKKSLKEVTDVEVNLIIDKLNPYQFMKGVQKELENEPIFNNEVLAKVKERVAMKMKKDPNAYRDLVVTNFEDHKKVDDQNKTIEVKEKNHVDEKNKMQKAKGQQKPKANTSAPKTENKKGKPKGVKEMTVTPKKAKGITKVMDMPGKEKVLDQLKESLKKSLKEDTHSTYTPGTEIETPDGKAMVLGVLGGTVTVKLADGRDADYQLNVLDHIANKAHRDQQFNGLPDLGAAGQSWLSKQVKEDDTHEANVSTYLKLSALDIKDIKKQIPDAEFDDVNGDNESVTISSKTKTKEDIQKAIAKLKEYIKKVLKKSLKEKLATVVPKGSPDAVKANAVTKAIAKAKASPDTPVDVIEK
jgi:ribosome modulation factor